MKFNTALLHGDFRGDKATGATLTPVYQGKSDLVLQPNITTRFILFNVTKAPLNWPACPVWHRDTVI